ncbi:MAG TPA: hypothetical protein VL400_00845 [Polyangiaceae bacterium]|nr:hypothetical protein [Polyangiaceae bacterium]
MKLRRTVVSGRALAAWVLAGALVRVLVARAFGAFTGLGLFRANYGPDRLPPVDPSEREAMASFGRCIACGRCDVGEAERVAASRGEYPGVMQFVLASSRSMPDFDAAERALAWVPEDVLVAKDRICPAGVPISRLARFVRAKAAAVREP